MKRYSLFITATVAATALTALLSSSAVARGPETTAAKHRAACNGSSSCKVCKDCSRCKYCKKEGNTCGACKTAKQLKPARITNK